MQGTDVGDLGCHSLRGPSEDGDTWLGQAGFLQIVLLLAQSGPWSFSHSRRGEAPLRHADLYKYSRAGLPF